MHVMIPAASILERVRGRERREREREERKRERERPTIHPPTHHVHLVKMKTGITSSRATRMTQSKGTTTNTHTPVPPGSSRAEGERTKWMSQLLDKVEGKTGKKRPAQVCESLNCLSLHMRGEEAPERAPIGSAQVGRPVSTKNGSSSPTCPWPG